jgi:hypothetical protein
LEKTKKSAIVTLTIKKKLDKEDHETFVPMIERQIEAGAPIGAHFYGSLKHVGIALRPVPRGKTDPGFSFTETWAEQNARPHRAKRPPARNLPSDRSMPPSPPFRIFCLP